MIVVAKNLINNYWCKFALVFTFNQNFLCLVAKNLINNYWCKFALVFTFNQNFLCLLVPSLLLYAMLDKCRISFGVGGKN